MRVASRFYKSPELLFEDTHYHYSLDIWSAGCTMAELLFGNGPLFVGKDNLDQLVQIAKILGSKGIVQTMKKYQIELNPYYQSNLSDYNRIPLKNFIHPEEDEKMQAKCNP